jgi:TonB family protein
VYQAEWSKRGLTGKGVVLVTVDKSTGKVTGAQILQSTGNKLLHGSALEAYSRWRFAPGTVSQLKIPVEFTNRRNRKRRREHHCSQQFCTLYSLSWVLARW